MVVLFWEAGVPLGGGVEASHYGVSLSRSLPLSLLPGLPWCEQSLTSCCHGLNHSFRSSDPQWMGSLWSYEIVFAPFSCVCWPFFSRIIGEWLIHSPHSKATKCRLCPLWAKCGHSCLFNHFLGSLSVPKQKSWELAGSGCFSASSCHPGGQLELGLAALTVWDECDKPQSVLKWAGIFYVCFCSTGWLCVRKIKYVYTTWLMVENGFCF